MLFDKLFKLLRRLLHLRVLAAVDHLLPLRQPILVSAADLDCCQLVNVEPLLPQVPVAHHIGLYEREVREDLLVPPLRARVAPLQTPRLHDHGAKVLVVEVLPHDPVVLFKLLEINGRELLRGAPLVFPHFEASDHVHEDLVLGPVVGGLRQVPGVRLGVVPVAANVVQSDEAVAVAIKLVEGLADQLAALLVQLVFDAHRPHFLVALAQVPPVHDRRLVAHLPLA